MNWSGFVMVEMLELLMDIQLGLERDGVLVNWLGFEMVWMLAPWWESEMDGMADWRMD